MQFSIEYLKDLQVKPYFLPIFDMFMLSLFSHLVPCAFPIQTVTYLCNKEHASCIDSGFEENYSTTSCCIFNKYLTGLLLVLVTLV